MAFLGEDEQEKALVLDNGSATVKAGFSGDDAPCVEFPSIIGRPRLPPQKGLKGLMVGCGVHFLVGDQAYDKRGVLNIKYPIRSGVVSSWDDMEQIWHYTFYRKLRVAPEEHPVLLTDCDLPFYPKANREKLTQSMFETFSVPAMYVAMQELLALYGSGSTTGVVVNLGHHVSHTVSFHNMRVLQKSIRRVDIGGDILTSHMMKIMEESGYRFTTTTDRDVAQEIKEKLTYVAMDFGAEIKKYEENSEGNKSYALPDGQTITIGNQQFRCPEALFDTSVVRPKAECLHHMLHRCIKQQTDTREGCTIAQNLYGNIVLVGGSSLFPGLQNRLTKELAMLAPPTMKVKVVAHPDRKYFPWIGGSIMASMADFQSSWITKDEFEDIGPSVVHRKCM